MARGVNKVILIGNLGRDPEIKYTPSGTAVANFSIATTERRKDRNSDEWREHTEWHRIVAFGRTAEVCGEYLSKGSQVYVEGRLQTRSWDDKEGNKRYMTEVVAGDVQFLGARESAKPRSDFGGPPPADADAPYADTQDDDIPF